MASGTSYRQWNGIEDGEMDPMLRAFSNILMAARGIRRLSEDVKEFQQKLLFNDGLSALIEVDPSGPDGRQQVGPRLAAIASKVETYLPRSVVFLGMSCVAAWQAIAQVETFDDVGGGILAAAKGNTTFFLIRHPGSVPVGSSYYASFGEQHLRLEFMEK